MFRNLLESSGGKVDCRHHDFGIDYTVSQNASLYASLLGVFFSQQFGRFDPEDMQDALSKSKLFAELSKRTFQIQSNGVAVYSDPESSVQTAVRFPCTKSQSDSFPLVNHYPTRSEEIMLTDDSEYTYRRLPSLRKGENNTLLLLTWSSTYHDQTLEVLSDWIKLDESLNLYQRLIEDLWLQQTPEEFALILAALLCRERLLLYTMDDTT